MTRLRFVARRTTYHVRRTAGVSGGGRGLVAAAAVLTLLSSCRASPPPSWLEPPETVAPGIELYKSSDTSLVDPPAPIAVSLLKIDPARARLASALSNDDVMGAEKVEAIAARRGAVAAVNGGFFNIHNGEPVGLLKVAGELVSDTSMTKGAVAIRTTPDGRTELAFDQVAVRMTVSFTEGGAERVVGVDGVDTTRERGKLMLYTPSYHEDTDTAPGGVEWILSGRPLAVSDIRRDVGHTPIPVGGAVLSFGGLDVPEPLARLTSRAPVALTRTWSTVHGLAAERLETADHVVAGAGLLKLNGKTLGNWETHERLNPANFINMRHPRTLVGVDQHGFIWLIAVDGRRADFSVGMTFADMVKLCERLGLRDALNLDGGGSTTMVVKGAVINRPTDLTGPRAVSDAIVVLRK
jgi:exopolysaccharide biosynthesis protein